MEHTRTLEDFLIELSEMPTRYDPIPKPTHADGKRLFYCDHGDCQYSTFKPSYPRAHKNITPVTQGGKFRRVIIKVVDYNFHLVV